MTWPEFQAWQQYAFARRVERFNNKQREAAGLPPVSRRTTPERGPQERPDWDPGEVRDVRRPNGS